MATLQLDNNQFGHQIRSYKPGAIQIDAKIYTTSLILTPSKIILDWAPQTVADITYETLLPAINLAPDILLIGTGNTHEFLPFSIYSELINRGIGVEIMDTRAACRTYNALASENRNVAAALLIK